MLIEFSVNNFKSIKDSVTFSMVSGKKNDMGNTVKLDKLELLPSAVIYGANASGKSNILEAFEMMRRIVLNQDKIIQSTDELPYNPFRLSTETEDASTCFDVVFTLEGKKYKYGFEYDKTTVYAEYLFFYETSRPTIIFEYDKETGFRPNNKITEVKNLKKLDNSLYLWKADQEGYEIAKNVLEWFKNCTYISKDTQYDNSDFYFNFIKDLTFQKKITELLKEADLGIQGIESIDIKDGIMKVKTLHQKYNNSGEPVELCSFDFNEDESVGTQKFFNLLEPILTSIINGTPLFIDEFDANLHPLIVKNILIKIFHNLELNNKFSQIIFTTQNTGFLNQLLFHKSQIWFTEKDKYGITKLTSLSDFKGISNKNKIEKDYILGRYGAIPYLEDFADNL